MGTIITSGGLAWMQDCLAAGITLTMPTPPSYIVLGSGLTPPSHFMTTVPGETYRTPIVGRDKFGAGVTYHGFLNTSDNANQTVAVYGVVAGQASAAANTGTLIAIVAESSPFSKDATKVLNVDVQVTVSGTLS